MPSPFNEASLHRHIKGNVITETETLIYIFFGFFVFFRIRTFFVTTFTKVLLRPACDVVHLVSLRLGSVQKRRNAMLSSIWPSPLSFHVYVDLVFSPFFAGGGWSLSSSSSTAGTASESALFNEGIRARWGWSAGV